jgi:hypothetical protein
MQQLADKYRDKKTPKGHDLRVDLHRDGTATIWFLLWGEYQGKDGHHHMGIATVRPEKTGFSVGTHRGNEQMPGSWKTVATMDELIAAIDKLVGER